MERPGVVFGDDDFVCSCGNTACDSGFHPCDEEGIEMEPMDDWKGHYACGQCEKIYLLAGEWA